MDFALAVGYSARSLAQALSDIGFRVISADAFGDCDTLDCCVHSVILPEWGTPEVELLIQSHRWDFYRNYPSRPSPAERIPVFLGGGCENWRSLIGHLASQPELLVLGPSVEQLAQLRSLDLWRAAAEYAGIKFPETLTASSSFQRAASTSAFANQSGSWLFKSLSTAGGNSVRRIAQNEPPPLLSIESSDKYLQREISGRVLGVTCVVDWLRSDGPSEALERPSDIALDEFLPSVRLLGVTEAWQANDWPGPSEFTYRGSWGPIVIPRTHREQVIEAVTYIARRTKMIGWIQLDLIEDSDGQLWFIEVNPRWSASMEVLRRSGLANAAVEHARAWGIRASRGTQVSHDVETCPVVGKAIVYCQRDTLLTSDRLARFSELSRERYADIPASRNRGHVVRAGHPLMTVLAREPLSLNAGAARGQLLKQLEQAANQIP